MVLCFKHGKALTLREREDVSFTHRSNDFHMPKGSFLLLRLKTHPSSFSRLYNFPGTCSPLPPPSTDAHRLLGGVSSRVTDTPKPGDQREKAAVYMNVGANRDPQTENMQTDHLSPEKDAHLYLTDSLGKQNNTCQWQKYSRACQISFKIRGKKKNFKGL